jgi:transposase
MKPISNEIRALLIEAKKRGEKEKDIAKWLQISEGSVRTIWRLYRESGSYLPTPYPGRTPLLTAEKWNEVTMLVADAPDKTLEEIIEELALPIRKSRLSVLLIQAVYSLKKRLAPRNKTAKMFKKKGRNLPKS